MDAFLREMYRYCPPDMRVMRCQFRGDPGTATRAQWRTTPVTSAEQLDPLANVYLTVSAMKKNDQGQYRRRKENFGGGILLMIDDIGGGPGSKFPLSIIDPLQPTALIETSPNNYQAIYMFNRLVTDVFDRLIHAFIEAKFLGKDTGMAGVNRVFRPPFGVNGKPKYGGWEVRAVSWTPEARYSPERIADAFGLDLSPREAIRPRGATIDQAEAIRTFVAVRAALGAAGMLKQEHSDTGWQEITCPWVHEHSDCVDDGAAISIPNPENGYQGGFRCHHGGCAERGWRELTDWLADNQAFILEQINRTAK
jgi:hypothetical protein